MRASGWPSACADVRSPRTGATGVTQQMLRRARVAPGAGRTVARSASSLASAHGFFAVRTVATCGGSFKMGRNASRR